jgi:hypothetical protein
MVLLETVEESGETSEGSRRGTEQRVLQRASRACMDTHVCSEKWTNYRNRELLRAGWVG